MSASWMFNPDKIKAVYVLTQKPVSAVPPRLKEVVCRVAMLSSFLPRKGDGEPGVKTIWIGLQRVVDFAAWVRCGSGARAELCVMNALLKRGRALN